MANREQEKASEPREGDRFEVFDYRPWLKSGDVGDNSCFFFPATVVRVRKAKGETLVDVRFDHEPDRISQAHFTHALRPVRPSESGSSSR